MVSRRRLSFSLAVLIAVGASTIARAEPMVVAVQGGKLAGTIAGDVAVFKGIPYAAAPVGELRWRSPQPAPRWKGVREATAFGARCMQPPASPGAAPEAVPESEDCLYLNVLRPAGKRRNLPVMVWVPGGGLVAGAGSKPMFDGRHLASRNVIVVTINYRVGRFGFFAHPDLTRRNSDGGRLYNYGLMDQIAALQWVRRNIAAFGGDPAKVTIFGESAGGASVDALMIAPEARGLFARAIAESGYGRGAYLRISERSPDGDAPAEDIGRRIATRLGMPDATIDQLRAVPAARIQALFDPNDEHVFAVDGRTLKSDLWGAFARNEEAPVPFIIGSNSYEQGVMDPAEQRPWAEKFVPAKNWAQLTPLYSSAAERDRLLLGDIIFTTQARALAARHVANGHPAYLYLFDIPSKWTTGKLPGALHAAELRYVFGNMSLSNLGPPSEPQTQDWRVSGEIMTYWTNLAAKGDPNGEGVPGWPVYRGDMLMKFTLPGTLATRDPYAARAAGVNAASIDILP